jgi:hypothetical protein
MGGEANFVKTYRAARRDFIAACEQAGADAICRVHPAPGPDGKPLFCDCASFGPRDAPRALLVIAAADGRVTALLRRGLILPKGAKLVAVHALDPHISAWGKPGAPGWPGQTLMAIAAEDLSKVKKLTVLDIEDGAAQAVLTASLPRVSMTYRAVKPEHAEQAILSAIAAL